VEREERAERGEGRRGPRPEPVRAQPLAEDPLAVAAELSANEAGAAEFTPPAEELDYDAQAEQNRRRRRRRGGRDRDELREGEAGQEAPTAAEAAAEAVAAEGAEVMGDTAAVAEPVAEAAQPAAAAPQAAAETPEAAPVAAADEAGETGESRRRRRPRREREPAVEALEAAAVAEGALSARADLGDAAVAAAQEAAGEHAVPQVAGVPLEPAAEVLAPLAEAVVEPVPAVPAFDLPLGDLQALAESAGLQWVHSDADKVRAAQEAMAAEPKPAHVPRVIKPVVLVDEGPLVLVETRKDLAQVKLPFELEAQ
jgi:ribonuclease E